MITLWSRMYAASRLRYRTWVIYHPIAIGFKKIYATDARMNIYIRASVAYMYQNKTALKPTEIQIR